MSACIELYELIGSFTPSFEAESINIFLCVRCHFVKLSENWSIWLSREIDFYELVSETFLTSIKEDLSPVDLEP